MFITNKRLTLPKHIECDTISIEVDEFKLLGFLIDKK